MAVTATPIVERSTVQGTIFILLEPPPSALHCQESPIKALPLENGAYPRSRWGISRFYDREPGLSRALNGLLDGFLDDLAPRHYTFAIHRNRRFRRLKTPLQFQGNRYAPPRRSRRKGRPGSPQGEPLEHQDQAAVPAEPA